MKTKHHLSILLPLVASKSHRYGISGTTLYDSIVKMHGKVWRLEALRHHDGKFVFVTWSNGADTYNLTGSGWTYADVFWRQKWKNPPAWMIDYLEQIPRHNPRYEVKGSYQARGVKGQHFHSGLLTVDAPNKRLAERKARASGHYVFGHRFRPFRVREISALTRRTRLSNPSGRTQGDYRQMLQVIGGRDLRNMDGFLFGRFIGGGRYQAFFSASGVTKDTPLPDNVRLVLVPRSLIAQCATH